jgi:hypothetical protein
MSSSSLEALVAEFEARLDVLLDAPTFDALAVERTKAKLDAVRAKELHALHTARLRSPTLSLSLAPASLAAAALPTASSTQEMAHSQFVEAPSLMTGALDDEEAGDQFDLDRKAWSTSMITALRLNLAPHQTDATTVSVDSVCRVVDAQLMALDSRLLAYQSVVRRLTVKCKGGQRTVELNVGGERFHTSVATLCKEPSFLQGMFSGYVFFICFPRNGVSASCSSCE